MLDGEDACPEDSNLSTVDTDCNIEATVLLLQNDIKIISGQALNQLRFLRARNGRATFTRKQRKTRRAIRQLQKELRNILRAQPPELLNLLDPKQKKLIKRNVRSLRRMLRPGDKFRFWKRRSRKQLRKLEVLQ